MHFTCEHLSKTYGHRHGTTTALSDVSFRVAAGEFVCLVGPSGCGKTTLLKLIAGLLEPTSGRVMVEGAPRDGRPPTALVFQEHGLFPWLTVVDNVAFGLKMRGVAREERRARAAAFLDTVGLGARLESYPHELSVGMRQRVNIARALLVEPHALLMDEPFASLDARTKLTLQAEFLGIWEEHRDSSTTRTVVFVTHDLEEAALLADRVIVMLPHPGRIAEDQIIDLPRPRAGDLAEVKFTEQFRKTAHGLFESLEGAIVKRTAS